MSPITRGLIIGVGGLMVGVFVGFSITGPTYCKATLAAGAALVTSLLLWALTAGGVR